MHLPKCSRKLPYSLRSISPITRSVSILMRAACELVCLPFRIAGAATASFVKSRRDRARLVIGMGDLPTVEALAPTLRLPANCCQPERIQEFPQILRPIEARREASVV